MLLTNPHKLTLSLSLSQASLIMGCTLRPGPAAMCGEGRPTAWPTTAPWACRGLPRSCPAITPAQRQTRPAPSSTTYAAQNLLRAQVGAFTSHDWFHIKPVDKKKNMFFCFSEWFGVKCKKKKKEKRSENCTQVTVVEYVIPVNTSPKLRW